MTVPEGRTIYLVDSAEQAAFVEGAINDANQIRVGVGERPLDDAVVVVESEDHARGLVEWYGGLAAVTSDKVVDLRGK